MFALQGGDEFVRAGLDGPAEPAQLCQRALGRLPVAVPAGVGNQDGRESEVQAMPDRRVDAHLQRDSGDRERLDAGIAQQQFERGADKCRHGKLVEHHVVRAGLQLGHELGVRPVRRKWIDELGHIVAPLPEHRGAQCGRAGGGQWHTDMSGKDSAHPGSACRTYQLGDLFCDPRAVGDLVDNADLHVIDEQRHMLPIAEFIQRRTNLQPTKVLHDAPCSGPLIPSSIVATCRRCARGSG